MEGGELLDRLSKRKTFCEQDAIRLVRNILEAIRYLHDLKIAHRFVYFFWGEERREGKDLGGVFIAVVY